MSATRLGWRVYVISQPYDIYAYTIIGTGEYEALAIIRATLTLGDLRLRAKLVEVPEEECQLPPLLP